MRRAGRLLALALIALGLGLGALCFALMFAADSPYTQAADAALMMVDLFVMTGATFLVWPAGAR